MDLLDLYTLFDSLQTLITQGFCVDAAFIWVAYYTRYTSSDNDTRRDIRNL